ncbi:MAG: GAF domain-containing protein [Gammaproteobacteria bacterium]|nr:GAF domain-containing protein [Gammaproteobacteria bacterium]
MFELPTATSGLSGYALLDAQLQALLSGERDFIANAAQFSAFIYHELPGLNWAGFYLYKDGGLVLGPFQGKVACVRIPLGRGVCGTAAASRETVRVEDVHAFPGHIACDSASSSEIVLPVLAGERLIGVFDIDSPNLNRFSIEDQQGLETLVARFVALTDMPE